MDAYLASLPSGIDSYPQCEEKASIVNHFVKAMPRIDHRAIELPREVRALLERPLLASDWVREVHAVALYLAICDAHYTDEQFVAESHRLNRSLLESPLYKLLFMVVSPSMIMRDARTRWAGMHRGTTLSVVVLGDRAARLKLGFPTNLFPELLARCFGTAFRAALERTDNRGARMELVSYEPTAATFEGTW